MRLKDRLNSKKYFIFDWDGTIFNSMHIKYKNFSEVAFGILSEKVDNLSNDSLAQICDIYKRYSGKPRREIFDIASKACGIDIDDNVYFEFSSRLTLKNKKDLCGAAIFDDALEFIQLLSTRKIWMAISSSAPSNELQEIAQPILKEYGLHDFSEVLGAGQGGFTKGQAHIEYLMTKHGIQSKDQIIYFGDNIEDWNLHRQTEVECIVVDRDDTYDGNEIKKVRTFREIVLE